jgi:flagellar biosynthesis anti-sigma factor FlgM
MRVGQTDNNQVQGAEGRRTGKAQDVKGRKTDGGAGAEHGHAPDAVKSDISAKGKDFSAARGAALSASDTREDKIAELKRRISEGKYQVDADKVADRLVNEHLATADLG